MLRRFFPIIEPDRELATRAAVDASEGDGLGVPWIVEDIGHFDVLGISAEFGDDIERRPQRFWMKVEMSRAARYATTLAAMRAASGTRCSKW
jgi:hypothetical protein